MFFVKLGNGIIAAGSEAVVIEIVNKFNLESK
jgi:hypothetical protein